MTVALQINFALWMMIGCAVGEAAQLGELREYSARRGWQVAGEYVDHVSGAKESRPVLNRLMTDARQRKFDSVLVWKLGRFGRSLRHLVNAIAEFEALGVALISLSNCPNCPRLTIPIHGFGAFCLC